jgi:hypothetical protein
MFLDIRSIVSRALPPGGKQTNCGIKNRSTLHMISCIGCGMYVVFMKTLIGEIAMLAHLVSVMQIFTKSPATWG